MMAPDLFVQMNNALLDIQSADLQGVDQTRGARAG